MQRRLTQPFVGRPTRETLTNITGSITWVRDRALDHAVEKERDLKPMINLKNLIISEPSKSLPLSTISDQKNSLNIPTRPIDFIRKYPSIFHEHFPSGITIHPHVKLTPETLTLDFEERVLFDSDILKQDAANRLLKLLMLGRMNKIPLSLIDLLKWDLGLPDNYIESIIPNFPDYFKISDNSNYLELVCWNNNLAISVMEKNSLTQFPVQYSRGFEIDNTFKKWVFEFQKLPYVSPYQNVVKSDKFGVGLLHEILHLLVPKRTCRDNLLNLGEYLGVRGIFKTALLQHPGIFYVSSKLNTRTVVLREGYKRDLLVSRHPVMDLRSSYVHLMHMVKVKKNAQVIGKKEVEVSEISEENEEDDFESNGEDFSNEDDLKKERENGSKMSRRNTPNARGSEKDGRKRRSGLKSGLRTNQKSGKNCSMILRTETGDARKARSRSLDRSNVSRISRTKEGGF